MNLKAMSQFLTELLGSAVAAPDVATPHDWVSNSIEMHTDTCRTLRRVYFHIGNVSGLRDWWAESPC